MDSGELAPEVASPESRLLLLQALFDHSLDAILIFDSAGSYLDANPAASGLTGYSREEILQFPAGSLAPPGVSPHSLEIGADFLITGSQKGESTIRRKDGTLIRVAHSAVANIIPGVHITVLRDVTERRRAEEAERQARRAAERAAGRSAGLQQVTAALAEALTSAQVGQIVVERGIAVLGASAGSIVLLDQAGANLDILSSVGYSTELIDKWRRFPITAPVPLAETVRSRQPIFIESPEAQAARLPDFARQRATSYPAYAAVPLLVEGRVLGGLGLNFDEPQEFNEEDRAFILTLAGQCAQALERVRLYGEAQAELAARRETEVQLKTSLEEKEVLLREVHHRVRNNLQAVINLIYLQAVHTRDGQVRQVLQETRDRVKSIALIHEKLYQTRDFAHIDFAEYIHSLAKELINSYQLNPDTLVLKVQVNDISLDVDTAVPLGVIINELLSNALKHAFPSPETGPGSREGEIRFELRSGADQQLILTVSDNGVGLPAEIDLTNSPSLGLQLVRMLTDNMRGTLEARQDGGTTFEIKFTPLATSTL